MRPGAALISVCLSGNEIVLAEHFLDFLKSSFNLLLGVCGHEAETNQRVVGGNSRRHHRVYEYTLIKKVTSDCECLEIVADIERNNRCGCIADFAAHVAETFQGIIGKLPQMLARSGSSIIRSMAFRAAAVDAGVIEAVNIYERE